MKTKRFLAVFLTLAMLIGMMPLSALAYYEEPLPEEPTSLDVCTGGKTYGLFTDDYLGEDHNGMTFLYVVKRGGRYYTPYNPRYTEFKEVDSIPAMDITEYYDAETNTFSGIANNVNVGVLQYQETASSYMYLDGNMLFSLSVPFESKGEEWFDGGIRYYEPDQTYSYDRPLWQANGDGTGYFYDSYIDWMHDSDSWVYGVLDLKVVGSDYVFALRDKSTEYTEARNADPNNYTIGVDVIAYLYAAPCGHEMNTHGEADAPTCMEKGCHEYWYCRLCDTYFQDAGMTAAYDGFPEIDALGHDWDGEKCHNCNRPVPVYSKVTNKTDFFALADDTMYVLVAEYEGKYYTPDISKFYPYVFDSDGDGFYDIYNIDENSNGAPDIFEYDDDENGVYDYLEYYETEKELQEQLAWICYNELIQMIYGQVASIPAKEITLNPDGTISHDAVKDALEFEMVKLHTQEDIDSYIEEGWTEEIFRYGYECAMQFVVPNTFIGSPSLIPEDRKYGQRVQEAGDTYYWAVLFYNDRESYNAYDWEKDDYSGTLEFLDICKDGSIALCKSWSSFDSISGTNLECMRLRDYNGNLSFVVGNDYELEGSEYIDEGDGYIDTHDTQACVYLYASAPYQPSHTCDFGDWTDDQNGDTHTRTCADPECGKTETKPHHWDEGVQAGAPTCTEGAKIIYTCGDCGAAYEESVDALGHDWGDWKDDGADAAADTHSHACNRDCGVAAESEPHSWGSWTPADDTNHEKTCSICSGVRAAAHSWNEGVVTTQPTEEEAGVMTYTCTDCGHTKTETIPVLEHTHKYEKSTVAATCEAEGYDQYTCACGDSYTDNVVNALGHEWVDATCETAKTCSVCNKTEGEALGHKYENGICSVCGKEDIVANGNITETLTWKLDSEGLLTINGTGEMVFAGLQPKGNNQMVFAGENVAPWAVYADQILRVVIEEGVTSIADNAFENCVKLEKVTVAATVAAVGESAFANCESLKEITFQGEAPELGANCFQGVSATVTHPVMDSWTDEILAGTGGQIVLESAKPKLKAGDANGDGKVDYKDAMLVLRASVSLEKLEGDGKIAGDVDGNGKLDYKDAMKILRASVGLEKL